MRVAPAFRKRFGDFQPDHDTAVSPLIQWRNIIAELKTKITGEPSPTGRGRKHKKRSPLGDRSTFTFGFFVRHRPYNRVRL